MGKYKKTDLLLIHPGSNKKVYESLADDFAAVEPPFAAALTAAFVRNHGHGVQIIDANAENLSYSEVAERALEINPRLINIIVHGHQPSASSHLMGVVGETCREIKGRTNIPIILRGIHPSALPERTLREEACDFVGRGEGYDTLLELLNSAHPEKIPGLCYIDKQDDFRMNTLSPLISDLDKELPDVAWDLLPMNLYRAHNWHAFDDISRRKPYASLYTSLGCPFKCSFCCINAEFKAHNPDANKSLDSMEILRSLDSVKPSIRFWSSSRVISHIETLVEKYGVRHIKLIDEMFLLDKRHVRGISEEIIARGYDVNIWAYGRVDTAKDAQLLDTAKKAGINWLVLGIESASKHVRAGVDKMYSNEAIHQSVERVTNAGINVMGNYMFGLPDDTIETMQETLNIALQLNTPWFNGYAALAYPGAPLYTWAKSKGIPLPGDPNVPGGWTAYSHHSYYSFPLPTKTLPNHEVLAFRDKAFQTYFENPSYLSMVRKKFGDKVVDHLGEVTKHKIKRRILGDKTAEEYYASR